MEDTLVIDFTYPAPGVGAVTVEAHYQLDKPSFYSKEPVSDYNGLQEILHYDVLKDGKHIFIDIPEDVLYHNLREYIRNAEISGCFEKETGGF